MNIAHLCVLIAALLPVLTVGGAKAQPGYDNNAPRAFLSKLSGWRARAFWAHQNHFEAFPPFATGVILAELAHASQHLINTLAVAFIALRIVYTFIYIGNVAAVRSLIWASALGCCVWLIILSI